MGRVPINQNFNDDFPQLCGQYDAPARKTIINSSQGKWEMHFGDVKHALLAQVERYDIHVGTMTFFTDRQYWKLFQDKDAIMVGQKNRREITESDLEELARIGCTIPAQKFPGALKEMSPKNGFQTYGLVDGYRHVGNVETAHDARSVHPLAHMKILLSGMIKKEKVFFPVAAYGTCNMSTNAAHSFELLEITKNPQKVQALYEVWLGMYSLSERLSEMRPGMTPDLRYKKGGLKHSAPPTCPTCSGPLQTYPLYSNKALFRCRQCSKEFELT